MKKTLLSLILALSFIPVSFAQTSTLRDPGYKGSISLMYQGLACVGLETSHGAMLNQHHYLGVGAGAFVFPDGKSFPSFVEGFLDYQAYILKKNSTPVIGFKTGYIRALTKDNTNFTQGLSLQPEVGWNWAFNPKYGLTISAGANLVFPMEKYNKVLYALPRAAITFEF